MSKLEEGDQRAILVDCDYMQSKKKGTLGLVLTFNCLGSDNKAFAQTRVTKWITPNEGEKKGTIEYVLKDLLVCGLKSDVKDIMVLAEENAINKYFDQNVVTLNLAYERYEDREYLRVQYINVEGGSTFEKLTVSETKKSIKGMDLKGMLAKVRGENKTLAAPRVHEGEVVDEGDAIPFGEKKSG